MYIDSLLKLKPQQNRIKIVLLYIVIAYIFGLAARLILFYQVLQIDGIWNGGHPMPLLTPDSGRYGFYAKEILDGISLPLQYDFLLGYLIAGVISATGLSVDVVMLMLPIFLAPLIVIPIIIIGTSIRQPTLGFMAALIASADTYYYMRSNLGYADTDSINLFLILMGIALFIKSFQSKSILYATLGTVFFLFFSQWYHSAGPINLLIFLITSLYVFCCKRNERPSLQSIIIFATIFMPISFPMKLLSLLIIYVSFFLLNKYAKIDYKFYIGALVLALVLGLAFIDAGSYVNRAFHYFEPAGEKTFIDLTNTTYHYFNDLQFVGEVQKANLWSAYAPTYATTIYVLLGSVGFLMLIVAYPVMILVLPLLILGHMTSLAGFRFSLYAPPALALGVFYLIFLLKGHLKNKVQNQYYSRYINRIPHYSTILIATLFIYNILQYNTSVIIIQSLFKWEKSTLESFGKNVNKNDTILTWWEFGWPLWYFTQHDNTLTDNGKHGGPDSHIVAQMLLSQDQKFVANTAKLLSYYRPSANAVENTPVIPIIAKDYNLTKLFSDTNSSKAIIKKHKGDVYIILHQHMLNFISVILNYSNWDMIKKQEFGENPQIAITFLETPFSHNSSLLEGKGFILDSSDGKVLNVDGNKSTLHTLMITQENKRKESFLFHKDSNKFMIQHRDRLIWLDKELYNSFFFQAMLMDVYDKNLFEKVAETKRIKIFRVK